MEVGVIMYGIKKHIKGSKYEDDYLILDKNYQPLSMSRETAEMFLRQLHAEYGDRYSFKILRLD